MAGKCAAATSSGSHGERYFILTVWRETPHRFKSFFKELRHILR